MAINSNIALGVQPLQLADPLAQYSKVAAIQGAQQQNELARQQMAEYERARVEDAELRNYLAQSDLTKPETRAGLTRFGKTGLAYGKALSEQDTARLMQQKTELELKASRKKFGDDLKRNLSANPSNENVVAWGQDAVIQGIYTPQEVELTVQQLLALPPAERVRVLAQSGASASELAPKLSVGPTGIVQTPAFGGAATVVPGTAEAFQMTPAQIAQNAVAQDQLKVSQGQLSVAQRNANISDARLQFEKEKATQPQFNAQAGGFIAPPTKENPEGKFIPAKGIQATKDQGAAVKALQSAGYDPVTGEDTISKLIAKSTSGGLQAGSAATLAFFGKSTEGRKAISALEGTANQIATDLAGGKLGAGISNTDREFIVGALGDVANPMKTADERLAGWNAAKQRMMITGLIPLPKGKDGAAPAAPAAGANVVVTPDGQSHTFPTPAAAAQFKKAAGIP